MRLPTQQNWSDLKNADRQHATELFKLQRTVGEFEGSPVVIGNGRFGPYILHDKKYTSLPKDTDPMAITLDESIALIREKREQDQKRHLKVFTEDLDLEVINGRYGPYIAYKGKNYRLPKALHQKAAELIHIKGIIEAAQHPCILSCTLLPQKQPLLRDKSSFHVSINAYFFIQSPKS